MENLALLWGIIGPGVSGAIFGAGWWFWVDAVVCSAVQVSFLHYLPGESRSPKIRGVAPIFFFLSCEFWGPTDRCDFVGRAGFAGIFASLAALMFNCVNKDEIGYDYYSPYGDDSEWR